jgi:hypothetical protein
LACESQAVALIDRNEQEKLMAHTNECASCAAAWEEEQRLTLGLRNLAQQMNSLSAPAELEEKMRAAFRERGTIIPRITPVVRPFPAPRHQSIKWLAAIAAALLLAFGIVGVRARWTSDARPQVASTWSAQPLDTVNMKAAIESAPAPEIKNIETPEVVHTPRRNPHTSLASLRPAKHPTKVAPAVAANTAESNDAGKEVATDFYPIGYGTAPNLQDGGQLLRVELPRSAVARFGLPVNIDRTSERVKADVLVGADGLAQAIRFIH